MMKKLMGKPVVASLHHPQRVHQLDVCWGADGDVVPVEERRLVDSEGPPRPRIWLDNDVRLVDA